MIMSIVNNYTLEQEPEIDESELYGPEPYDINFFLPTPPVLSTVKLRLVPFVPRVHAAAYLDGIRGHESMFEHMPVPIDRPIDFLRYIEERRRDKKRIMFAAIDITRPDFNHPEWEGSFAGLFGLADTNKERLSVKIGPAVVLPAFQRTYVAAHAVGLLLRYMLDLPPSGVGFRRVRWNAIPANIPSNNLAKRLGFKMEGVSRWKLVVPGGYQKSGKAARKGDAGNGLLGSDSNEWAMCWDDWEEGGRELFEHIIEKVA
jgi:RimJ/RimL family protein N-acetyltransferase